MNSIQEMLNVSGLSVREVSRQTGVSRYITHQIISYPTYQPNDPKNKRKIIAFLTDYLAQKGEKCTQIVKELV